MVLVWRTNRPFSGCNGLLLFPCTAKQLKKNMLVLCKWFLVTALPPWIKTSVSGMSCSHSRTVYVCMNINCACLGMICCCFLALQTVCTHVQLMYVWTLHLCLSTVCCCFLALQQYVLMYNLCMYVCININWACLGTDCCCFIALQQYVLMYNLCMYEHCICVWERTAVLLLPCTARVFPL